MSSLNLERSQISGDVLQRIDTLTNLRKLNLDGLVVADSSQLTLPELSNVRWLQACSDSITDELLEQLKEIDSKLSNAIDELRMLSPTVSLMHL